MPSGENERCGKTEHDRRKREKTRVPQERLGVHLEQNQPAPSTAPSPAKAMAIHWPSNRIGIASVTKVRAKPANNNRGTDRWLAWGTGSNRIAARGAAARARTAPVSTQR